MYEVEETTTKSAYGFERTPKTKEIKTNVKLDYIVEKDEMIADVVQDVYLIPDVHSIDISDYNDSSSDTEQTNANYNDRPSGDELELLQEIHTKEYLEPRFVYHDGDEKVYIKYQDEGYDLKEFVEMAEKPQEKTTSNGIEKVILVDDLAIAAVVAIAASIMCMSVSAMSGELKATQSSNIDIDWAVVLEIVFFWPFMILSGDSAASLNNNETVLNFEDIYFNFSTANGEYVLKGFNCVSSVVEAIHTDVKSGYYYPCIFFPKHGWFFMSLNTLLGGVEEAREILLANLRIPYNMVHVENRVADDLVVKLYEEMQNSGTDLLSVYTWTQEDAYEAIVYANNSMKITTSTDLVPDDHSKNYNSGIQFKHYHPGLKKELDNTKKPHMCFGEPIICNQ